MTLEEAQERILQLETEVETLRTENGTLSENNKTISANLEKARELNQKLFERVGSSEPVHGDEGADDEEAPTCEEFAKTINI